MKTLRRKFECIKYDMKVITIVYGHSPITQILSYKCIIVCHNSLIAIGYLSTRQGLN